MKRFDVIIKMGVGIEVIPKRKNNCVEGLCAYLALTKSRHHV